MIAKWPKKLMIMKITVGLAILLIMLVTEERLLTLGTSKMFNMPMFPHGSDNSLFNWSPVILNCKKGMFNISKIHYRQAPQIGMFILSWHLKQYSSFNLFAVIPGLDITSLAVLVNSTPQPILEKCLTPQYSLWTLIWPEQLKW